VVPRGRKVQVTEPEECGNDGEHDDDEGAVGQDVAVPEGGDVRDSPVPVTWLVASIGMSISWQHDIGRHLRHPAGPRRADHAELTMGQLSQGVEVGDHRVGLFMRRAGLHGGGGRRMLTCHRFPGHRC